MSVRGVCVWCVCACVIFVILACILNYLVLISIVNFSCKFSCLTIMNNLRITRISSGQRFINILFQTSETTISFNQIKRSFRLTQVLQLVNQSCKTFEM